MILWKLEMLIAHFSIIALMEQTVKIFTASLINVNRREFFVEHSAARIIFVSHSVLHGFRNVVWFNPSTRSNLKLPPRMLQHQTERKEKDQPKKLCGRRQAVWRKIAAIFLGIYHLSECLRQCSSRERKDTHTHKPFKRQQPNELRMCCNHKWIIWCCASMKIQNML